MIATAAFLSSLGFVSASISLVPDNTALATVADRIERSLNL
jgi:hypothetical protein